MRILIIALLSACEMEIDRSHEVPVVVGSSQVSLDTEGRTAMPAEPPPNVDAFCRRHATDYQDVCDGIGPLHIPMPPHLRIVGTRFVQQKSKYRSHELWLAALTSAQRKYYDRHCMDEIFETSDLCGENTPLVLAFHNEALTFVDHEPTQPWLTANGMQFGNATIMSDGHLAPNGFVALADFDSNRDRVIDARDARFGELRPANIVSISLVTHVDPRCDTDHNCEGERASFTWRDDVGDLHEGTVIDVYRPRLY
jgi:hypothetical protein